MRNLSRESCYEILRIRPGAGPLEVQRAFRQRVLECHPDLQKDPAVASEAELKRVVHAYRLLTSGRALSRHDLLEEAFKATAESSDASEQSASPTLPRLTVSSTQAAALMVGVATLNVFLFLILYHILSSPPPAGFPAVFELAPDQIACVVVFLSAQVPGAAAAAGENVILANMFLRSALGGIVFGTISLFLGVFPILSQSELSSGVEGLLATSLGCVLAGLCGGALGGMILYTMRRYEVAIHHRGGQSILQNRITGAAVACANVGLAWIAILITVALVLGIPAGLLAFVHAVF
ncbi:MAG: J domain-containing protein [Armatimonadetes bacterium]|nr:J domain-containing protein [Armatimonadota bacterium]